MKLEDLTAREREIFALAASGATNAEIAADLDISENAVRYHLKEIHSKFETGGRRSRLSWRSLKSLFPTALLTSRAASMTATGSLFAAGGVLALGAVLARPHADDESSEANACPTAFSAWQGATFQNFAMIGQKSVAEIRALNPGLLEEDLDIGVEVNVGSMDHAECGEAIPTFPAGAPSIGGTPQGR